VQVQGHRAVDIAGQEQGQRSRSHETGDKFVGLEEASFMIPLGRVYRSSLWQIKYVCM